MESRTAGAAGWGWDEVVPVFRDQERWGGDDGDLGRGRGGPMLIEPNRNARALTRLFVEAARRAGLGDAQRYNGHAYSGAWIVELAHKGGKRHSAYDACLLPAMRRRTAGIRNPDTWGGREAGCGGTCVGDRWRAPSAEK